MDDVKKHPVYEVHISSHGAVYDMFMRPKKLTKRPDGYPVTSVGGSEKSTQVSSRHAISRTHMSRQLKKLGARKEGRGHES